MRDALPVAVTNVLQLTVQRDARSCHDLKRVELRVHVAHSLVVTAVSSGDVRRHPCAKSYVLWVERHSLAEAVNGLNVSVLPEEADASSEPREACARYLWFGGWRRTSKSSAAVPEIKHHNHRQPQPRRLTMPKCCSSHAAAFISASAALSALLSSLRGAAPADTPLSAVAARAPA